MQQEWMHISGNTTAFQMAVSSNWVSIVDRQGHLGGLIPESHWAVSWLILLILNLGCALGIVALVEWQFSVHHSGWKEEGGPPPTGWVVVVVRIVDASADGVSFFTGGLMYTVLASMILVNHDMVLLTPTALLQRTVNPNPNRREKVNSGSCFSFRALFCSCHWQWS